MRIERIEGYLNSGKEEELNKVIEEIKESIEKIDYYANTIFKGNLVNNPEESKKTLSILTGYYMDLNPIAELAYHKAESIEAKERNIYRMDVTKDKEGKFTTTDNEQSKIISREKAIIYKRIANIVGSYREDCKVAIGSLQSILKSEKREYNSQGE